MGVARAFGHKFGNGAASDGTCGLHRHLKVETISETPHDLANIVSRKSTQCVHIVFS